MTSQVCRFTVVSMIAILLTGSVSSVIADDPKPESSNGVLRLNLRTRVQPFKGSDLWEVVAVRKDIPARETAIIICDMWDKHWCGMATERCDAIAKKMGPIIDAARSHGVQIIHAPSDCMDFYKDAPQRKRIQEVAKVQPPKPLVIAEPKLPIDDSDGGCDDVEPAKTYKAWSRQHAAIPIADPDVISDKGDEVYSLLKQKGIKNLIIMGVHTNMCVLGRSFTIRQMTRWGMRCVLVRDLTDSMYNPKKAPYVSHEQGTELVVQHIEKYWCPTILSSDLKELHPSPR